MKIALIGYGKMGKRIESCLLARGHTLVGIIEREDSLADRMEKLSLADVAIDFSVAESVLSHLQMSAKLCKNFVIGTTGWDIQGVETFVKQAGMGVLYAPNFSIGIHLFYKIVSEAAQLLNAYEDYDVAGIEVHHNQKKDSPSGTARRLADILIGKLDRKQSAKWSIGNQGVKPEELHFTSVRVGQEPGTHSIVFDSLSDTITVSHQARNREGFALGAVKAAEWLQNRQGFFSLEDMI